MHTTVSPAHVRRALMLLWILPALWVVNYIVARKALDILENTALMGQAGQPQPSPIVVTTPVLPPVATSTQTEAPVAVPAP